MLRKWDEFVNFGVVKKDNQIFGKIYWENQTAMIYYTISVSTNTTVYLYYTLVYLLYTMNCWTLWSVFDL